MQSIDGSGSVPIKLAQSLLLKAKNVLAAAADIAYAASVEDGHQLSNGSKSTQGGYIPFFVTERKRSEVALIQVVRKHMFRAYPPEKWKGWQHDLGIDSLSGSQGQSDDERAK